ncbi:MAG TPA: hypothetical protein VET66_00360 [Steroidobacteraceae bacterium]|nr:hypothetical protein [Steroidobacteraceae bacterium]
MRKPSLPAGWLLIGWSCTPVASAWGPQGQRTAGARASGCRAGRCATVGQPLPGAPDKFGNPSGRTTLESLSMWSELGSPDEWALQSNSLARNVAYHYPRLVCNPVQARIVVPERAHRSEAAALVRVPRAGALLEQALAMPGPTRRP